MVRYTRLILEEKDSRFRIERRQRSRGGDGGINREEEMEDRQRRGESVRSHVPVTDD